VFTDYRVRKVETIEELKDVYNHFLLYYGSDLPKMRMLEREKRREERAEGAEDGRDVDDEADTMKQASRKSGYTICVKNKIGTAGWDVVQALNIAWQFIHLFIF